jgi:hypothetical protein
MVVFLQTRNENHRKKLKKGDRAKIWVYCFLTQIMTATLISCGEEVLEKTKAHLTARSLYKNDGKETLPSTWRITQYNGGWFLCCY